MKLKKLRDLFFFVALLTIFSNKLYANPQEFISQLTSDASKILASSQSKEDKMIALIDLAEQNVDIEGIGMYTLGKHRKSLNEKQTEEYKLLFRKYFLKSFASRLSEYTDPKITVLSDLILFLNPPTIEEETPFSISLLVPPNIIECLVAPLIPDSLEEKIPFQP